MNCNGLLPPSLCHVVLPMLPGGLRLLQPLLPPSPLQRAGPPPHPLSQQPQPGPGLLPSRSSSSLLLLLLPLQSPAGWGVAHTPLLAQLLSCGWGAASAQPWRQRHHSCPAGPCQT